MHREVRPSRFEIPTVAKVVIWAIVGLIAVWVLAFCLAVKFCPGLFR